ncbi:MAG: cytochrome ubiquinol oxidase subunit I [Bacillota bacterium]
MSFALYLYGWERLSPLAHWLTGIPVALGGAASSVLVVASNAWMQNPGGVELVPGLSLAGYRCRGSGAWWGRSTSPGR